MPTDTFDPLAEWLGIPPSEQPPDHYRLLGLATFESDAATIEQAADERMTQVRRHQTGPRAAATQQVLNWLAAAKQCLLNPATRGAYDAAIRGQQAACKSPQAAAQRRKLVDEPPAFDIDMPPVAAATEFNFNAEGSTKRGAPDEIANRSHASARRRAPRLIVLTSFVLSLITCGVGVWVLANRGESAPDKPPVVVVKRLPSTSATPSDDAPPLVRPDGGVLRCTAEYVSRDDVHRRGGNLLDLTLADGPVEVSWTVRVRKAGFYTPSITYSAVGEGSQTFEIEFPDASRRSTPIRATAGAFVTDELKPFAFRRTGDHRVVLRAAGTADRGRTIKVRELQLRPIGQPALEKPDR